MDFDPKCLFENPPRMKEDVKSHVKSIATSVVNKIIKFASIMFESEKINEHHVQIILLNMSFEPITSLNKQGLCNLSCKLKPLHKVLSREIEVTLDKYDEKNKYANLDKKIVKSCEKIIKLANMRSSTRGNIALACIVTKVIGILLESSIKDDDVKTITMDMFEKNSISHKSATGEIYPYSSMMRYLHIVNNFTPNEFTLHKKPKEALKKNNNTTKKYDKDILEQKVSFVDVET